MRGSRVEWVVVNERVFVWGRFTLVIVHEEWRRCAVRGGFDRGRVAEVFGL